MSTWKKGLFAAGLLAIGSILSCDPKPSNCEDKQQAFTVKELEDAYCSYPGQAIGATGDYCVCTAADQVYNGETGQCDPCVPACDGRECGPDGCDGFCSAPEDLGRCPLGSMQTCVEGSCVTCVPDCDGKACGSDGCDGFCGTCGAREQCQEGSCIAGSGEGTHRECSCDPRPPGAYNGAMRPEQACNSGAVRFVECGNVCPDGLPEWSEACDRIPTGSLAVGCTCLRAPAGPGQLFNANICEGGVARGDYCYDAFGYYLPCGPGGFAWFAVCATCD